MISQRAFNRLLVAEIIFGVYGFTRGFRSPVSDLERKKIDYPSCYENKKKEDILFFTKVKCGLIETMAHTLPPLNIISFWGLCMRIEKKIKKIPMHNSDHAPDISRGIFCDCYDTI